MYADNPTLDSNPQRILSLGIEAYTHNPYLHSTHMHKLTTYITSSVYGYIKDDNFRDAYLNGVFNFTEDGECNFRGDPNSCTDDTPLPLTQEMCYQNTTCRYSGVLHCE